MSGAIPEFRLSVRVYIEDTDAGGIVYYVNYLKYFERARTELMRSLGFAKPARPGDGYLFVVNTLQVDYLRSAELDDELLACAQLNAASGARLQFAQRILRNDEELCRGMVGVACVDPASRKPLGLPPAMRELVRECGPLVRQKSIKTESIT